MQMKAPFDSVCLWIDLESSEDVITGKLKLSLYFRPLSCFVSAQSDTATPERDPTICAASHSSLSLSLEAIATRSLSLASSNTNSPYASSESMPLLTSSEVIALAAAACQQMSASGYSDGTQSSSTMDMNSSDALSELVISRDLELSPQSSRDDGDGEGGRDGGEEGDGFGVVCPVTTRDSCTSYIHIMPNDPLFRRDRFGFQVRKGFKYSKYSLKVCCWHASLLRNKTFSCHACLI